MVSAALASGFSVQRRKPSSRAAPEIAVPSAQEMQRQEQSEQQARDAMHDEGEVDRVGTLAHVHQA